MKIEKSYKIFMGWELRIVGSAFTADGVSPAVKKLDSGRCQDGWEILVYSLAQINVDGDSWVGV